MPVIYDWVLRLQMEEISEVYGTDNEGRMFFLYFLKEFSQLYTFIMWRSSHTRELFLLESNQLHYRAQNFYTGPQAQGGQGESLASAVIDFILF